MSSPIRRIKEIEKLLSGKSQQSGTVIIDYCGHSTEIFINGVELKLDKDLTIDELIKKYCKEKNIKTAFRIEIAPMTDDNICVPDNNTTKR